jgi:uncharacterized membrane protein
MQSWWLSRSVGLVSLQGGVANALLGGLTGSTVSLSVVAYNALASATEAVPRRSKRRVWLQRQLRRDLNAAG